MSKKVLILVSVLILLGFVSVYGQQEKQEKAKIDFEKKMQVIEVRGPNVHPWVWVECCYDFEKTCGKTLREKGFIPVDDITIGTYNSGDQDCNSGNGKVEFFDVYSNTKKTFNFTLNPVKAKGWGTTSLPKISGPFLVKGEIKVSVTFEAIRGPKTNTVKEKDCSILY